MKNLLPLDFCAYSNSIIFSFQSSNKASVGCPYWEKKKKKKWRIWDPEFLRLSQEWNGLLKLALELKDCKGAWLLIWKLFRLVVSGNLTDLVSYPLLAPINFVTLVKFLSLSFLACKTGIMWSVDITELLQGLKGLTTEFLARTRAQHLSHYYLGQPLCPAQLQTDSLYFSTSP